MIPLFPEFKKIEIDDRGAIELYARQYPLYSDFNFTNLFAWDVLGEYGVSLLNGNLAVRFFDYHSQQHTFSFIGENMLGETAKDLITFSAASGNSASIYFMPEEIAMALQGPDFTVQEDRNNFDYIFSVPELASLGDIQLKKKRMLAEHFLTEYPEASFEMGLLDPQRLEGHITQVLERWQASKKSNAQDHPVTHEDEAVSRLLETAGSHNLVFSCIFLKEAMIAFSIDEIMPNGCAMSYFFKADSSFKGIYDFFNKKIAERFLEKGVTYWNWEQDLGIENLRKSKMSYYPTRFLKKYTISLTQTT